MYSTKGYIRIGRIGPVHVYAIKGFERFRRKERLSKESLIEAVDRAESGLVDAGLGGGLIKQRTAPAPAAPARS